MGLFGPKPLPSTSYSYDPPPGATAHGWKCTNLDCGVSDHEVVRRWPKPCMSCGSPTDPLFDQPWEHEAEGVELQWLLRNHPERGGGFYRDQWEVWQFKDALFRGDRAEAAQMRSRIRPYAAERLSQDDWWGPGSVFFHFVWFDIEARDLDGAADDLVHWLSISKTDDVENNNTNRTNSRQVIDMAIRFFDAGGASHPRAAEIRQGCVKIGEGAFQVLNREMQVAVTQMARA